MVTAVQSYNPTAGTNALTAEQHTYYVDAMLERLKPELTWLKFGKKTKIPKRKGATANFRRVNRLNVATTAITEGVTPDGVNLDVTALNATVKEYGNWTKISEFLDMTGFDPILTEAAEVMGENAGESIDSIVRDVVGAGTNVMYGGGKLSRATVASTDKITTMDILRARRTLKKNRVKKIKLPNGKSGYLAFISPDVATDLMQTDVWERANVRNDTSNFTDGFIGSLYGVYFMEVDTPVVFAGAGASGIDVHGTIFIGQDAYGVPDVEGSSKPEIIVHPAGSAGTADPLNQFNTVAWKAALATVRLEELAIVRLETAATA